MAALGLGAISVGLLVLGVLGAAGITIAVLAGTGVIFDSSTTTTTTTTPANAMYRRFLTLSTSGDSRSIKFSANGILFAEGGLSNNATIYALSGSGNNTIATARHTLSDHSDDIQDIAFSSDSSLLATVSLDDDAKIWDTATGNLLHTLTQAPQNLWSVDFSSAGLLATGSADDNLRIYHVNSTTATLLSTQSDHTDLVLSVAFCPSNPSLLASGSAETIVWNVTSGASPVKLATLTTISGPENAESLAFNSDCSLLAAGYGIFVTVYRTSTYNPIVTVQHDDDVNYVAFDANDLLLTASDDDTVGIWNPLTGVRLNTLVHPDNIQSVTASASGLVAACDDSNKIVFYSL